MSTCVITSLQARAFPVAAGIPKTDNKPDLIADTAKARNKFILIRAE